MEKEHRLSSNFLELNKATRLHFPGLRFEDILSGKIYYLTYMARKRRPKREAQVNFYISAVTSGGSGLKLEFDGPNVITEGNSTGISQTLTASTEHSDGLLILVVEGYAPWLQRQLSAAIPLFPMGMLDYLGTYQRATYGQAVLPTFDDNGVEFAIEHVNLSNETRPASSFNDDFEALWTPLVIWCCLRGGIPSHPSIPIILIAGMHNIHIRERLSKFYSEDKLYRFIRLKALPHWIFADLFTFTQWDKVWGSTSARMNRLRKEVYGEKVALPILEQTRALHRYMETIINQRECLRIHAAFVKAYIAGLNQLKTQQSRSHFILEDLENLEEKMIRIEGHLEHHQLSSETSLRSMENLLQLAFNTEAVSQGLQVKRLNYLALIFLPLGFVAAVFGMTNTTLRPVSYPAYAFPILIGTILLGYIFGKGITWFENFRARRARARDILFDEEAQHNLSGMSLRRPSRPSSRCRQPSTPRPPTLINEKLSEDTLPYSRRTSRRDYNQRVVYNRGGPPIREASEMERSRRNRSVTVNYSNRSRTPTFDGVPPRLDKLKEIDARGSPDRRLAERQNRSSGIYKTRKRNSVQNG